MCPGRPSPRNEMPYSLSPVPVYIVAIMSGEVLVALDFCSRSLSIFSASARLPIAAKAWASPTHVSCRRAKVPPLSDIRKRRLPPDLNRRIQPQGNSGTATDRD